MAGLVFLVMLIITEKPSVAREFAAALTASQVADFTYRTKDGTYTVTHCVGHLLQAAPPEHYDPKLQHWSFSDLPILPNNFIYLPIQKSKNVLKEVVREIKKATGANEEILIATDAGPEGEAIARLVMSHAGQSNYQKATRFWESEALSEAVIRRGISRRQPLSLYNEIARRALNWKKCDWLYGINMTRLYSLKRGKLSSVGRVQTAVLYELYKRQKERKSFITTAYHEVQAEIEEGIKAVLIGPDEESIKIEKEEDARSIAGKVKKAGYLVVIEEKKETNRINPPSLYNIVELEKDAYKKYGLRPDETMEIAQYLYEKEKVLSYPRTPSRVMGESDVGLIKKTFDSLLQAYPEYGKNAELNRDKLEVENKALYDNSRLVDHHALIPLKPYREQDTKEYRVWRLVADRLMEQAAQEAIVNRHTVRFGLAGMVFRARYSVVQQQGWKTITGREEKEGDEEYREKGIQFHSGEHVEVTNAGVVKKKTKPREPYSYASILAFMENPSGRGKEEDGRKLIGIGTPATRHEIIKVLEKRNYIKSERKSLIVLYDGEALIEEILKNRYLADNISAKTTTEWEEIAQINPERLVQKTTELVKTAITSMEGKMTTEREVFGKCPKCGGNILEGESNYYCSNYKPENGGCQQKIYKRIMGVEMTKDMIKNLFKLKTLGQNFKGTNRDGQEVEFSVAIENDEISVKFTGSGESLGRCPKCGRDVLAGPKSYYCSGYKENDKCEFVLWRDAGGAIFTADMAKKLLLKQTIDNVECKTKGGEAYKAGFRMNDDGELVKITYGGGKKNG